MIELFDKYSSLDLDEWDLLIEESNTSSFFQTKECYNFYISLSFLETFIFCVYENGVLNGIIVGYILKDGGTLKRFLSRRAIVLGGALLSNDISEGALGGLLQEFKSKLSRRAIYIEFRNFNDYSKYKSVFEKCEFEYRPHLNFNVDCTSQTSTISRFSDSKKRQIKKAFKNGASINEVNNINDVIAFYGILKKLYDSKVKTPLFPLEFFITFFELEIGKIFSIVLDKQIIGGIICPIMKKKVIYEWFIVGQDLEFKDYYPSVLATYSAIKYALDNNIQRFDFMGAGRPNEAYGVRDFKSKFGGELVEYGRFLLKLRPILYYIGKIGIMVLKK